MKLLTGCLALAAGVLTLSGCAGQSENRSFRVGVVLYNQNDTFVSEVMNEYRDEITKRQSGGKKIRLRIRNAALSQRTENAQVKDLLEEGCDLLCVNLVERSETSTIIHAAMKSGIPVIFFNREPVREDLERWNRLYYIGTDAKESGRLQGEIAARMYDTDSAMDKNGDGKIQYVILEGEPGHQDAIIRTSEVVETLNEKKVPLEKMGNLIANWSRAQAENRITQMLEKYPDSVELILANSDDMALGAVDAYDKQGISEEERPVILGVDGTKEGLEALEAGKIDGTVYSDIGEFGEKMADMTYRILNKKSLRSLDLKENKWLYLPFQKVTKDNVNQILDEES